MDNRKLAAYDKGIVGVVRRQDTITGPAGVKVAELMERNTHAIPVNADVDDAAHKIACYDVIALPMIDAYERLIGIIAHDDALDVIEAVATEDFQQLRTATNLDSSVATATARPSVDTCHTNPSAKSGHQTLTDSS